MAPKFGENIQRRSPEDTKTLITKCHDILLIQGKYAWDLKTKFPNPIQGKKHN